MFNNNYRLRDTHPVLNLSNTLENAMKLSLITAVAVLFAVTFLSASVHAAPVIDGQALGAAEGYQYSAKIVPSKDADKIPPATVYFAQDAVTYDLCVAVVMPLAYVDNTYGEGGTKPSTHTHFTWRDDHNYLEAKEDEHKFGELVGSDQATFVIELPGVTTDSSEFKLDYLKDVSSGVYDSGHLVGDGKDDDGVLSASATSLDWNLHNVAMLTTFSPELAFADPMNPGEDEYAAADPMLSDWIFEIVYEFKIDGSYFDNTSVLSAAGFTNGFTLDFKELHASPNKTGEFKDVVPEEFVTLIPTPTAGVMGSLLLIGMIGRRSRRGA
ncbi:hypothetical protein HED60_16310 [Planctomycetales bacterium ZRK34]|nr:hypothetical protein HED60_16310 [Planctomycetales bacterium ZRK34]